MEYNYFIWNSTVEEIVLGYKECKDSYLCTLCGKEFKKGLIFSIEDKLYDVFGAINEHHISEHGYNVDYILSQETSGFIEEILLRREMYNYRFINRTLDGKIYWKEDIQPIPEQYDLY